MQYAAIVPRPSFARMRLWAITAVSLLVLAATAPFARAGMDTGREPISNIKPRSIEPTYKVVAGIDGDIFPVFANFASFQKPADRQLGIVAVTVSNSTSELVSNRVAVQIAGWSDEEIQIVELGTGQVRKLLFAPTFRSRFYGNREITAATAKVTVSDMGGREVYAATVPVRLRSVDDMYWGKDFINAQFIASWVTPHDSHVEAILSRAKEFMVGRRLPGYESWKSPEAQERTTYAQAKAIYRALQKKGVSYVKSSATLGPQSNAEVTERVRMPQESLRHASANCIDGVVLYASLFENLGMNPVIVLVPGHAYVGVRVADGSDRFLYLETSLTGRARFETALRAASVGLAKYKESQIRRIPIATARQAGIYPMPGPAETGKHAKAPTQASERTGGE